MNTIIKLMRLVLAIMITLGMLGISSSVASAAPPVMGDYSYTVRFDITDICEFPITLEATNNVHYILFFDDNGALTREKDTILEQDSFSANGKTLVGYPFHWNMFWSFDSSGKVVSNYSSGPLEMIPLPDGSLFISAGRVNGLNHPGASFIITPDMGHSGDIEAFCAALAP